MTNPAATPPSLLVIACGALARELRDIVEINGLANVEVECLPAKLHNTPSEIPAAVAARLARAEGSYDHVLVGYADCGTAGRLDEVLATAAPNVDRLPGAHCYEFFAGATTFAALHDAEPGTFYLTDYLARHFDRIVISGLGLDRHPELRDAYFQHYRRVVYLAQTDDPELVAAARAGADRLGLELEVRKTGYGELEPTVVAFRARAVR